MANDDLNFDISIGVTDASAAGLNSVDQRFAKTRAGLDAPIKPALLGVDLAGLDAADKRVDAFKSRMREPIKIPPMDFGDISNNIGKAQQSAARRTSRADASPIDDAIPSRRNRRGRAGVDEPELSPGNLGAGLRDDFAGPARKPRFADDEQAIRDAQAGMIRGMDARAKADQKLAAEDARLLAITAEARKRLGLSAAGGRDIATKDVQLGDTAGPAARPRFDDDEQRVRDAQARLIRAMDEDAKAMKESAAAAKAEATARERLGLKGPRDSVDDPDRLALRQREEANRTGNVAPLTAKEAGFSSDTFNKLTAAQARARNAALNGSGGPSTGQGGPAGDNPTSGASGLLQRLGIGVRGASLGDGARLVGPAGIAAAGLMAVGEAAGAAAAVMKEYKDLRVNGADSKSAGFVGFNDFIKGLPVLGRIASGVGDFIDEMDGTADKERARAKNDQKAKDTKAITDAGLARDQRGRDAVDPLQDAVRRGDANLRIRDANNFDPTGAAAARIQAKADYADQAAEQKHREDTLRRNQQTPQNGNALSGDDFTKAIGDNDALKKQSADALAQKLAEIDRQSLKATSDRIFGLHQEALQAQGETLNASIADLKRQGDEAMAAAKLRIDEAEKKYGKDSDQARTARNTYSDVQADAAYRDQNVGGELRRQRDNSLDNDINQGLARAAGLGNEDAARDLAKRQQDELYAATQHELDIKIEANKDDEDRVAVLRQQRQDLDGQHAKAVALAQQQAVDQARQRRGDTDATLNSYKSAALRNQADKTGDGGKAIQADQLDVAEQYRQKAEQLRGIESSAAATDAQKAAAGRFLNDLPGQLTDALKKVGNVQGTNADLAANTFADRQEGIGNSGFAAMTRENLLTDGGKSWGDKTADNTGKLVELFTQFVNSVGQDGTAPTISLFGDFSYGD